MRRDCFVVAPAARLLAMTESFGVNASESPQLLCHREEARRRRADVAISTRMPGDGPQARRDCFAAFQAARNDSRVGGIASARLGRASE
jgi:hypothetical protein